MFDLEKFRRWIASNESKDSHSWNLFAFHRWRDLKKEARRFASKLKNIKVCAFDIDGILTDGTLRWEGPDADWNRSTFVPDGQGMRMLIGAGLKVGVITAGNSPFIKKRFDEGLHLDFIYQGNYDKREAFLDLMSQGYKAEEILYMGDELFDIPLLKKAGFSATCPEAAAEVRELVDYITAKSAGRGSAREVMDLVMYAQNIDRSAPDFD